MQNMPGTNTKFTKNFLKVMNVIFSGKEVVKSMAVKESIATVVFIMYTNYISACI